MFHHSFFNRSLLRSVPLLLLLLRAVLQVLFDEHLIELLLTVLAHLHHHLLILDLHHIDVTLVFLLPLFLLHRLYG